MPAITIRGVPPHLHQKPYLHQKPERQAKSNTRSLHGELLQLLQEAVFGPADRAGPSGYDAEDVTRAEGLGVRLLTAYGPVLQACPEAAVQPGDFAGRRPA